MKKRLGEIKTNKENWKKTERSLKNEIKRKSDKEENERTNKLTMRMTITMQIQRFQKVNYKVMKDRKWNNDISFPAHRQFPVTSSLSQEIISNLKKTKNKDTDPIKEVTILLVNKVQWLSTLHT